MALASAQRVEWPSKGRTELQGDRRHLSRGSWPAQRRMVGQGAHDGVLSLALPLLAGAAAGEAVDHIAPSFLLQQCRFAEKKAERERGSGDAPASDRGVLEGGLQASSSSSPRRRKEEEEGEEKRKSELEEKKAT